MGPLAAGLWAVGVVNWPDCRVASSVALDPRVLLAARLLPRCPHSNLAADEHSDSYTHGTASSATSERTPRR